MLPLNCQLASALPQILRTLVIEDKPKIEDGSIVKKPVATGFPDILKIRPNAYPSPNHELVACFQICLRGTIE